MGLRVVRRELRPVCSSRVFCGLRGPSQLALTLTPLAVRLRGLTHLAPSPGAVAADAVTSDRRGCDCRPDPRSRLTTRRRDALASLRLLGWSIRISVVRERGPICGNSFGTRRHLFSAAMDMSPTPAK